VDTIEISWELESSDPTRAAYFVNGSRVGSGDAGFDSILELIRLNNTAKVTLTISRLPLGGEDLKGSTPFAGRFAELEEALGARTMLFKTR
jgi:hypothetical protein